MPVWLRLSIGGAATLLVGMGLGRFSYTPLIPALIEAGELTAAEAGAAVGVMMIYSLAIVTRHAPPGRLGTATGIVFAGVGIGILMSGILVPPLLDFGLAAAWTGLAVVGAAGVCVAFWGWRPAMEDGAVGNGAAGEEAAPLSSSVNPAGPRLAWTPVVVRLVTVQALFSLGLIPH